MKHLLATVFSSAAFTAFAANCTMDSTCISSPTLLSFAHDTALDPEYCTKSPFLIDEFKIWKYPKTDFEL